MNTKAITEFVKKYKAKEWYYYYNFDGIEVRPELKDTHDAGMTNWNKIWPIIQKIFKEYDKPRVLDVGCNMGLYDLEMEKAGAEVTGVDINTEHAIFFQKYIRENKKLPFKAEFIQRDVMEEKIPLDEVDIVTMFCVLYHFEDKQKQVFNHLPKHSCIILQGNLPRVTSKKRGKQKLAGIEGMVEFLEDLGYKTEVFDFKGYSKPLVIGRK